MTSSSDGPTSPGPDVHPGSRSDPQAGARRRSMRGAIVGSVLEWYDWVTYATFSTFIAQAMFAPTDTASALLQTLAVFAVGFAARPLGGLIFGRLADRRGRKVALTSTMTLMATGSLLLGLIPSYATIGVAASLLLVAVRFLQGVAHGGETGSSYVYVTELAPPRRRGLWSSLIQGSATLGTVLGTVLGLVLTSVLTTDQLQSWGWRMPFLLGAVLAVYAYFLRRTALETQSFSAVHEARTPESAPAPTGSRGRLVFDALRLLLLIGAVNVPAYIWLGFASTFAISAHGMAPRDAFLATFVAQLIHLAAFPLFGWLSDRIGRKPLAIVGSAGFVVLSFPLQAMLSADPWSLFLADTIALLLISASCAVQPAILAENTPPAVRGRLVSLVGAVGAALFGGTAALINTMLSTAGLSWVFTLYVVVMAAIGVAVVVSLRETRGVDLVTLRRSTEKEVSVRRSTDI